MHLAIKSHIKAVLFGFVLTATMAISSGSAHASMGIDFSLFPQINENGGPESFGASSGYTIVGWSFMPTVDLYLNRLGVYDADADKIHPEAHQIGIWSASDTTSPLASVTINEQTRNTPASTPLGALFHFASLGQTIILHQGETYYVAATLFAGNTSTDFDSFASFDNSGAYSTTIQLNPYIQYLGNAYGINTSGNQLIFPGSTTAISDYTIGANIDVTPTPIPAAAWLVGSGLMGLVGIRRRKR